MTQRTIKFRAWNFPTKQMIYWGTLQQINETDRRNVEAVHNHFMQFTGLTDKNGKEIYEGDILGNDPPGTRTGIVIFEEGKFTIQGKSKEDRFDFRKGLEVIGNVYENPELLNKPTL